MNFYYVIVATSCCVLYCIMTATANTKLKKKTTTPSLHRTLLQRRASHHNELIEENKSLLHNRAGRKTQNSRRSHKRQFLPNPYPYTQHIIVRHHPGKSNRISSINFSNLPTIWCNDLLKDVWFSGYRRQ